MSDCYPTYRTGFDRMMQEKHSDCCKPQAFQPCYPQEKKAAAPPKKEEYADPYLAAQKKRRNVKQRGQLQGRWDQFRPGGCGSHCGDGFCTIS